MLPAQIKSFTWWMAGVLVVGTAGYTLIEGWGLDDGFYMSVITLATVGYGETQQLTPTGRLFTCGLIFVSIISLSCWTACLTGLFVDREISNSWHTRKAKKMASSMKSHTIVCGSGAMAQTVIKLLLSAKEQVVVVDSDTDQLNRIRANYPSVLTIPASAVDEIALANANVIDAKCVIATLDCDFDNLLIAMTCCDLGTDIKIIARSDDLHVASRMTKMGVENVICPYHISGEQAAKLALW